MCNAKRNIQSLVPWLNIWEAKLHFTLKNKIENVTPSQYKDIP